MTFRLPFITPAKKPQSWATPDGTLPSNLNLFTNPIPFNQLDWSKPQSVKIIVSDQSNLPNIVIQPVVVSTPFFSQDFSKPFDIPLTGSQIGPNLVLQSFSTPFYTQDFSKPFVPPLAKPDVQSLNINIFTNPIPFGPFDYQKSTFQNTVRSDATQQLNLSLNVGSPFIPVDYQKTIYPIYYRPDASQQLNLPQNVGSPLIPIDYNKPFAVASLPPQAIPFNNNLFTSTVVFPPFIPYDFSKPYFYNVRIDSTQQLNPNLFTNPIPFGPFDWSKPYSIKPIVSDQSNLPDLVLQNFSTPFVQTDWSKTGQFRTIVSDQSNLPNTVLLNPVQAPLNQIDWSKPYRIIPIASDQNNLPNLLLIQPSVSSTPLGIFGWTDWNKVKSPVILIPDQDNLPNLVLLINPTPPVPPVVVGGGKEWRWKEFAREVERSHQPVRSEQIKEAAAVLSKLGGHARAASLTAKQRSNIASTAAQARWNPPAPKKR